MSICAAEMKELWVGKSAGRPTAAVEVRAKGYARLPSENRRMGTDSVRTGSALCGVRYEIGPTI